MLTRETRPETSKDLISLNFVEPLPFSAKWATLTCFQLRLHDLQCRYIFRAKIEKTYLYVYHKNPHILVDRCTPEKVVYVSFQAGKTLHSLNQAFFNRLLKKTSG